ncbi:endonuclease/exonuclease/phosphatase family protein [Parvicella tangerina]|uniref:Endonuclease/exonuclease/phosphatase domain-containing protein n=1 Tax=Parvicella tangerina TaxID=2829795 RepID=A0A916NDS1_9FLAO|nr:hypothetical protein [Parvicella tangerina]CAG5087348.1 hypothetical protein CRYO30217_03459 [Parvicella tangerina]
MKKAAKNHSLVFYNVENLYDTIDDKGVKDSDFTPSGNKHWTLDRLSKKLVDLAETIDSIPGKHAILIGLTEVENRSVALQLLQTSPLSTHQYALLHEDSPDNRGIDVCVLYDQEYVNYLSHYYLRIHFPWNKDIKTRDVLFFECAINGEKLWVVINHWPSRMSESSAKKRDHVAKQVRAELDKIIEQEPKVKILLMGDFNDEPNNLSLERHLEVKRSKNIDHREFYNLAADLFEAGEGTCVHDGHWLMIDQIMINRNLLQNNNNGFAIEDNKMYIHGNERLIYHKKGHSQPNHTYSGDHYVGGISDHLPVYVKIV